MTEFENNKRAEDAAAENLPLPLSPRRFRRCRACRPRRNLRARFLLPETRTQMRRSRSSHLAKLRSTVPPRNSPRALLRTCLACLCSILRGE